VVGLSASGQAHAVTASFLGWTLDAFDFFVVVFLIDRLAADFHVGKKEIIASLFVTLVMRPVGALIFGLMTDRLQQGHMNFQVLTRLAMNGLGGDAAFHCCGVADGQMRAANVAVHLAVDLQLAIAFQRARDDEAGVDDGAGLRLARLGPVHVTRCKQRITGSGAARGIARGIFAVLFIEEHVGFSGRWEVIRKCGAKLLMSNALLFSIGNSDNDGIGARVSP
jgi:MFS family permease